MTEADLRHMRHALALGRRGMGRTWPNPSVGCVIVKDGRIIGRGHTAEGGRPHAETQALAQAGAAAHGATAYVTLEPCAHKGETPPCAKALINAGIARVVAPFEDNDPRVSGKGFALLREAGIDVTLGICTNEAARDLGGFLARQITGRPFITLKLASSFDGRIATATGESQWITGEDARRHVHLLRSQHDAVMVGGGTARADDPSLTVRGLGPLPQPVRIVLSRRLDLPMMSTLAQTAKDTPLWLVHGPDADTALKYAWDSIGAHRIEAPLTGRQLDLDGALTALAKAGLTRIFCEGGGALAASLLAGDYADELIGYTAGLAIGAEGVPSIGAMGLEALRDAQRFNLIEHRQIGADVLLRWIRS